MLKARDLRTKNINELNEILSKQVVNLQKQMSDLFKGKDKNVSKMKYFRKDIARLKTIISEKRFLEDTKNA